MRADELEVKQLTPDDLEIIKHFMAWCHKKLHVHPPYPRVEISYDKALTQQLHRTGSYEHVSNVMTVYAGNRNLVDVLRTIAHELQHKRQGEQGRIHQKSPPGSKLEREADAQAGYLMKLYGAEHPEIFK